MGEVTGGMRLEERPRDPGRRAGLKSAIAVDLGRLSVGKALRRSDGGAVFHGQADIVETFQQSVPA